MGAEHLNSPRTRDPRNPGLDYIIIRLKRLQFLLPRCVDISFVASPTFMGKWRESKPSESMRFKLVRSGGKQKAIPLNICSSDFNESRK